MKAHDEAAGVLIDSRMDNELYKIRHSLAHILAYAVMELYPGTKLGFGPPIEDGFYYDFILPKKLADEDLREIEKKMKHIIKQNHAFIREDLPAAEALARIEREMGEPYKKEYAKELITKNGLKELSFYRSGKFLDMCEGPHVENSNKIPGDAFKLRSIAGAYWRGDSRNTMMTRIYAWAFKTKEELDNYIKQQALALERDHKKLGKELDLFVIDDEIGKGLPLWLPNGTVIRDEIEKLAKEMEFKAGYERVATPHMAKTSLYYKTGHLPLYAVHMYPFMELKEKRETESGEIEEIKEAYCLRPMNCPHHHKIFAARPRSYRNLPLRLAEYGQVYRFEDSGALSGLLRVRGMCMNDAHIYCTEDQIKDEFLAVMKMHDEAYEILGFKDYYFRFSTWDPEDPKGKDKYVHNPEGWAFSEKKVREVLVENNFKFIERKGEAAFYGPKIDVQFKTVTGREETASTCELDFCMGERLDLKYSGADNAEHRPYILHRAPFGTHERFVAFLIELYGGAFPTWLAPVQARVITVSEKFDGYGKKIVDMLRGHMLRAELDPAQDTMGKKIRNGTKQKIPNLLIVGEKEEADGTVTLRRYGREEQQTMSLEAFEKWILERVRTRARD